MVCYRLQPGCRPKPWRRRKARDTNVGFVDGARMGGMFVIHYMTSFRGEVCHIIDDKCAGEICNVIRYKCPGGRRRGSRRRRSLGRFRPVNSCSQMRRTVQPRFRRAEFTRRSRALLVAILSRQNFALVFGWVACFGQPCQKQPSTKRATRSFGKMKSAFTRPEERPPRKPETGNLTERLPRRWRSKPEEFRARVLALATWPLALRGASASEQPRRQPVMPFARKT